MVILDLFEKLINEHGSASILRERLLLVRDQCVALESKYTILKSENNVLKEENVRLTKENSDLNGKINALPKPGLRQIQLGRC